jgi:hypothetical protein
LPQPQHQFSPELQQEFTKLRQLVSEADFTVKSKFPPQLRAPLAATAIKAVELEEYGDVFFKHLPEIFPYNKFTMTVSMKIASTVGTYKCPTFAETRQATNL